MKRDQARRLSILATIGLTLLATTALFAGEGVLEIDQACVAAGCFPGDTPGLPVQITQPGSYLLTSNLTVPNANTDGILASADDVTLDLGGFAILGPVTCSGGPLVCTPAGTGIGVNATSSSRARVHNGTVRGMGNDGVVVGLGGMVERVRAESNGDNGMRAPSGLVAYCTAVGNGGNGISVQVGNVTDSIATGNGDTGITTLSALVANNNASQNDGSGIATNAGTVTGNVVTQNDGSGIVGGTSTVSFNMSFNNGENGIQMGGSSLVIGNTVANNTGYGLRLGDDAAFRENVLADNVAGHVQQFFTGAQVVDLGANSCDGTTTCTIDPP